MASPLDDQSMSKISSALHQQILSQFEGEWVSRLNVDQMFILIDGILPFEACLYYQVLPLFLEGNRLHLGMVSPDDTAASEYVRRIISYLNYSLISHSIASDALRVVLTAYLNHVGSQQISGTRRESFSVGHYRHSSRLKADQHLDANERLTLVVDSPEDLYAAETNHAQPIAGSAPPPLEEEVPPTAPPILESELLDSAAQNLAAQNLKQFPGAGQQGPAGIRGGHTDLGGRNIAARNFQRQEQPDRHLGSHQPAPAAMPHSPEPPLAAPPPDAVTETPVVQPSARRNVAFTKPLTILHVQANYLASPIEVLTTLPSQELVQELLARVLLGGIGRLYFERYPQDGRVVWSQNGILQSVLDHVSLSVFQGIIHQLKEMAGLSQLPVKQPQQNEIEYLYDRSCVLLRFRFMPGRHGEEATVQVLRGAALKFYQQQQLSKLERDAIGIAKQLQNKLNEIRVRAYSRPNLLEAKFEMLPKLGELLHHIEEQLDALGVDDPAE